LYVWRISAKVKRGSDVMENEHEEQEGYKEKKDLISNSGGMPG
jgi:hypothetical protein